MKKRQIFDQVMDMKKQIGEFYEQLGDLQNKLSDLLEENNRLEMENHHLRNRLQLQEDNEIPGDEVESYREPEKGNPPGEGYDNLARIYEEGFHICNLQFGSPRQDEDCIFCLELLSKKNQL
ncbi:DNA replication initiation control protein YabA [Virgibacillus halophilus]|uniref:DNA replication initiation control protein YabA n=1 Tax=Tigheibacillus halophilus TaxID=361280 RepID=UPI00363D4445